ncbi:MAG: ATP phosphoribosyltransferase regulatory subunit, partial [Oscillospiraceae bacterium]
LPESMYKLTDSQGRLMVLRPDNTLPIARVAATRLKEMSLPIRLYYTQKVFRQSPSLTGLNDEAAQSGIELVGSKGLRADLEIITTAVDALDECGVKDYRIEIGHAGFFKALSASLNTDDETREKISILIEAKNYAALNDIIDNLETNETTRAIKMLPRLFGGVEVLDKAAQLCASEDAKKSLDYLKSVYSRLADLGLGNKINIDLGLVHRSNYYTGVVFRGYIEGSGITVLSGGRYDMLIGEFGNPLPATGFGVEVDALANAMLSRGEIRPTRPADVLVFGENGCEIKALKHLTELTEKGFICENSVFETANQSQKYARKKGIKRFVLVTAEKITETKI